MAVFYFNLAVWFLLFLQAASFIAPQTCAKIQYKYTYVSMKGLYNLANKQECTLGAVVGLKRDGCVCLTDFS